LAALRDPSLNHKKITTAVNAQSDRPMSEDEFLQMQKKYGNADG
jgi:hypothetical protein